MARYRDEGHVTCSSSWLGTCQGMTEVVGQVEAILAEDITSATSR